MIRFSRIGFGDSASATNLIQAAGRAEAGKDDQALFIGSSRESYRTGRGRRQRASRCHDLHGERGECGALVAAASEDGQRRGWEDGGPSGLHSHWRTGWLTERIAAEPEVTVRGLMTELAERGVARQLWHGLEFHPSRGNELQKKACCRPSKIAPTWRAAARVGKNIRRGLILPVSSSSMKPGSRPTWLPSEVGARGAGGSRQRSRTVTGRQ